MRFWAAFFAAIAVLVLMDGTGRAQETAATYHDTRETFGCVAADSARALTDPDQPGRYNAREFRAMFDDGRCVTITPRSPWKLISVEDDMALMSYAGTVGAPGTFFMRVALLVDPQGRHPGDAARDAEPDAATAASPESAPTSLSPQQAFSPAPAAQPPAGAPASSASGPAVYADPNSSPTALAPQPPGATPAPASAQTPPASPPWASVVWVLLMVALLVIGIFVAVWMASGRSIARLVRRPGYKVKLPAQLLDDAKRLAATDGIPLDPFLSTLIAERIGELKSRGERLPGFESNPERSAAPSPAIRR